MNMIIFMRGVSQPAMPESVPIYQKIRAICDNIANEAEHLVVGAVDNDDIADSLDSLLERLMGIRNQLRRDREA